MKRKQFHVGIAEENMNNIANESLMALVEVGHISYEVAYRVHREWISQKSKRVERKIQEEYNELDEILGDD